MRSRGTSLTMADSSAVLRVIGQLPDSVNVQIAAHYDVARVAFQHFAEHLIGPKTSPIHRLQTVETLVNIV